MTIQTDFILYAIIWGSWMIDCVVDGLNLSQLKGNVPLEFKDVFNAERYELSQRYEKTRTSFDLFKGGLRCVLMTVFISSGGFEWVDLFARSFGFEQVKTGLVFMGSLFILMFVYSLPLSAISTFYIEKKFGFNKSTVKLFISDQIKGFFLALILGGAAVALVLLCLDYWQTQAWIFAWLGLTIFQTIVMILAPILILPLFNKFSVLSEGKLRSQIEKLAREQSFSISGIFTMDGSKRSTKSNAFFTGFGKLRRIVLFDTLVSKHTPEELVAVLAHEIGHAKRHHVLWQLFLSIFSSGLILFLFSKYSTDERIFTAFKVSHVTPYAGLVFFMILVAPLSRVLDIVQLWFSRRFEFEADAFAAGAVKGGKDLTAALKKLSVDNLSNLTPHPLKVFMEYSHPPVLQRVHRLKSL